MPAGLSHCTSCGAILTNQSDTLPQITQATFVKLLCREGPRGALLVCASRGFCVVVRVHVDPAQFIGTASNEDSLFVGLVRDGGTYVGAWYNNFHQSSGIDIRVNGQSKPAGDGAYQPHQVIAPGDRFALQVHGTTITSVGRSQRQLAANRIVRCGKRGLRSVRIPCNVRCTRRPGADRGQPVRGAVVAMSVNPTDGLPSLTQGQVCQVVERRATAYNLSTCVSVSTWGRASNQDNNFQRVST